MTSSAIYATDRRHAWHPFTQMQEYLSLPPLAIASGQGGWLTDLEGRRYLDGNASIWTNVHGHNDPDLNAALLQQLGQVAHSTMLGLTHPAGAELTRDLVDLAPPGLSRVFFSDNGAGAVEVALKMSFQYWQMAGRPWKKSVIGLAGGYHGDTFGTMSVGDCGFFHDRFRQWCFPSSHFPAPLCREWAGKVRQVEAGESLTALRRLLDEQCERTACVIVEPSVQGAAGMRLLPAGFLKDVADMCRARQVHLIADEVFVGFGRVGPLIVCREEGVQPDFLCLAKGLTAGYLPLAATLTTEEVYRAFLGSHRGRRAFYHGHTFTGNPLAAAVAVANIRKLRPLVENGVLRARAAHFGAELDRHFAAHPRVGELRHRGFAAALDLVPQSGQPERFDPDARTALTVCLRARERGLLIRPLGDSLLLVPPLCLSHEELSELVRRTAAAIADILP